MNFIDVGNAWINIDHIERILAIHPEDRLNEEQRSTIYLRTGRQHVSSKDPEEIMAMISTAVFGEAE